jgi:hypothetical protein
LFSIFILILVIMAVLGKFVDEVVQDNHGDQASLTR